ncbi:mandelate racemase [Roseobacter sp. YSTF-M11]|uniref:Mandelate racemase n=1 Tax=Roseobacter insulae TaxID=2859783 RepID=A0A9X1FXB6_9RHOB|nr:enolase C-terminal domain-like protein [Roseobacter insulae]MBW4709820.1 mandelate racemase [Roseobacter insulae]
MRIVDIRERVVPLHIEMRNAAFSFQDMTTSIVAVITDVVQEGKPVVGYGFNSTGRYACGGQMRDRVIPRLLRADPDSLLDEASGGFDIDAIHAVMIAGEKPGGDLERSMAIGTVETAIWDAMAKIEGVPLHVLLARRYGDGTAPERMFCYVGGGWYMPEETRESLQAEMQGYLDAGYTLLKTKIGGLPIEEDRRRIESILAILEGPHQLAVDANCGMSPERALDYAAAFKDLGLAWFEEPAHPVDFEANRAFVEAYGPPVATGENLFSLPDLQNLLRYGGMRPGKDILQIDVQQNYGYAACARSMTLLGAHGWNTQDVLPHGGNQMALAAALGFGMQMCEAYPNVFGVFSGYADDADIVDGSLPAPTRPGIGFEGQADLYALFRTLID